MASDFSISLVLEQVPFRDAMPSAILLLSDRREQLIDDGRPKSRVDASNRPRNCAFRTQRETREIDSDAEIRDDGDLDASVEDVVRNCPSRPVSGQSNWKIGMAGSQREPSATTFDADLDRLIAKYPGLKNPDRLTALMRLARQVDRSPEAQQLLATRAIAASVRKPTTEAELVALVDTDPGAKSRRSLMTRASLLARQLKLKRKKAATRMKRGGGLEAFVLAGGTPNRKPKQLTPRNKLAMKLIKGAMGSAESKTVKPSRPGNGEEWLVTFAIRRKDGSYKKFDDVYLERKDALKLIKKHSERFAEIWSAERGSEGASTQ